MSLYDIVVTVSEVLEKDNIVGSHVMHLLFAIPILC